MWLCNVPPPPLYPVLVLTVPRGANAAKLRLWNYNKPGATQRYACSF
jgi:hypothetical protein